MFRIMGNTQNRAAKAVTNALAHRDYFIGSGIKQMIAECKSACTRELVFIEGVNLQEFKVLFYRT